MKPVLLLFFFLFSFPLVAQEAETPEEEIGEEVVYGINQQGDQFVALKLNFGIPYRPFSTLRIGGSASLGYQHFIFDNITIGGNVSFGYNQTIGSNVFYFVPIMFGGSYHFNVGQWEIPLSLEIGCAFENYIDRMYFGFAIRPEIAGYYRFNQDWSFGAHTGLFILPQWYSDSAYNYTGLIHDIGISVRYHF